MMPRRPPIRARSAACGLSLFGLLLLALSVPSRSQSLPATQPTRHQVDPQSGFYVRPRKVIPTPRADIRFDRGWVAVTAQNASLNQILRDIAHLNGMIITGSVRDERVFGTYGPAPVTVVLNQLLDGTKVNVLVHETPQHTVKELVLSPRGTGTTAPLPRTAVAKAVPDSTDLPPEPGQRRGDFGRRPRPQPESIDDKMIEENQRISAAPIVPPATDDDTSQEQSPNGVKTPQEIEEELKELQQPPPQPNVPQQN